MMREHRQGSDARSREGRAQRGEPIEPQSLAESRKYRQTV